MTPSATRLRRSRMTVRIPRLSVVLLLIASAGVLPACDDGSTGASRSTRNAKQPTSRQARAPSATAYFRARADQHDSPNASPALVPSKPVLPDPSTITEATDQAASATTELREVVYQLSDLLQQLIDTEKQLIETRLALDAQRAQAVAQDEASDAR